MLPGTHLQTPSVCRHPLIHFLEQTSEQFAPKYPCAHAAIRKSIYRYTTQNIVLKCKLLRTNLYLFTKYQFITFLRLSHLSPIYPFLHPSIHFPSVLRQCLLARQWVLHRAMQRLPKNPGGHAVKTETQIRIMD